MIMSYGESGRDDVSVAFKDGKSEKTTTTTYTFNGTEFVRTQDAD